MTTIDWPARLAVDPRAPTPLYHQLRERLRAVAASGAAGTLMPTERALTEYAGVSRATARKAIADLVQEGLLITRQGSGTYTAPVRVPTELGRRPAGFRETMVRLGRRPSSRVVDAQLVPATAGVAERLGVAEHAPVVELERLRLLDGEPCMLERAYLPAELVPGLLGLDLTGSLYEVLGSAYGLRPATGTETIIAVNADAHLARTLNVPVAAALIATARTTRTDRDVRLEYTIRHARGDMCSFSVALSDTSVLADYSLADPLLTG